MNEGKTVYGTYQVVDGKPTITIPKKIAEESAIKEGDCKIVIDYTDEPEPEPEVEYDD